MHNRAPLFVKFDVASKPFWNNKIDKRMIVPAGRYKILDIKHGIVYMDAKERKDIEMPLYRLKEVLAADVYEMVYLYYTYNLNY